MFPTERPQDNPVNWSFPVGRLFGVRIKVHVAFILCAVILVWMEMPKEGEPGPGLTATLIDALGMYAILFLIVLFHEFGHCFGARFVGGEADEILLWPLGGLAYANPPHNAAAHMATTVAGPLVNVFICMICTLILVVWTGRLGAVPWNPLHPTWPVDATIIPTTGQHWTMMVFGLSYFLLLINLLPIFPFDGGRIVQAWLWPKKGYTESMAIATTTGMIGAVVVGLFGLFAEQSWLLMMIAVFGYLTCYQTRRQLKEQGEFGAGEFGYDFSQGYSSLNRDDAKPARGPGFFERRRARKEALKAEWEKKRRDEHDRAVERILAKISATGMDSLTPSERRTLEHETQRQRSESEDG